MPIMKARRLNSDQADANHEGTSADQSRCANDGDGTIALTEMVARVQLGLKLRLQICLNRCRSSRVSLGVVRRHHDG